MNSRLRTLLLVAGTLILIAALFGNDITRSLTTALLLRQDAPNPTAAHELFASAQQPERILKKFWRSQRIPHRYLAISYIKQQVAKEKTVSAEMKSIVEEAVSDVDISVQELAFTALRHLSANDFDTRLRHLFRNKDDVLRMMALHQAKEHELRSLTPQVIHLMDDPNPLVVTSAAGLLRQWTNQDFGLRNHDAIAKAHHSGIRTVAPENLKRIRTGAAEWKEWWKENRESSAALLEPTRTSFSPARLPAQDFALTSINDKIVRLSEFRGKTVVLNFWTTWCTACALEMPELVALQERHPDNLVVLGISLDGSDEHGHDHAAFVDLEEAREQGLSSADDAPHNEHVHQDDHEHGTQDVKLAKIKKKIRRTIARKGLNYQILLNPTGTIGIQYNGQELPTNVLIDKEGYIRRRFIGSRTLETWEAMLAEIR